MILLLKQKEAQIIKERDQILQSLELRYMNYVQQLFQQKSFITRNIREQYDECLNNVNNLIYNTINNTININSNLLINNININNLINNIAPNPSPQSNTNTNTNTLSSSIPKPDINNNNNNISFIRHMCLEDVTKLSINDKIDHRDIAGAFYPARIIDKKETKLKIHYIGWNSEWDVWCDIKKDLYKFAKYKSISSRSKHRLFNLKIGDMVDINPIRHKTKGWLIGEIIEFDEDSAQVKISYNLDGGNWVNYFWTHLDNKNEIDQVYTHTLMDNITGDTPFQCLYCKYSFISNDKLRQHIKLDHLSRPHLCNNCPQAFHAKNGLDSHLKQHLNNTNCQFKCNICKKLFNANTSFRIKSSLTAHLTRVHKIIETKNSNVSTASTVTAGQKRKHNDNGKGLQSKKVKYNNNNKDKDKQIKERVLNCKLWKLWFIKKKQLEIDHKNKWNSQNYRQKTIRNELKQYILNNKLCDKWKTTWDNYSAVRLEQTFFFNICKALLEKEKNNNNNFLSTLPSL